MADVVSNKEEHVYFSMNMPDWFMERPATEKCKIVEALADQLKNEKSLSPEQRKEFFSFKEETV